MPPVRIALAAVALASVLGGATARALPPWPPPPRTTAPPVPPPPPPPIVTAKPGEGLVVNAGRVFSISVRGRAQVRYALVTDGTDLSHELTARRARLLVSGHLVSPHVRYNLHVGFSDQDFERGNPSPLYDAWLELTHLRDLNLRVGQFLVPFTRQRTISAFFLQMVDRPGPIFELNLDRDVGIMLSSSDLGGLNGRFGYRLFVGMGDGRNRAAGNAGLLYAFRFDLKPFGGFDDTTETDLERLPRPRLAVGLGAAYNHDSVRALGTRGADYALGTFDTVHGSCDVMLKVGGFTLMVEAVLRWARRARLTGTDAMGRRVEEWSRSAWGYFAQVGYVFPRPVELAVRYGRLVALDPTDPALVQHVAQRGQEAGASLSFYIAAHVLKLQGDYFYLFGDDPAAGAHQARVQLQALF